MREPCSLLDPIVIGHGGASEVKLGKDPDTRRPIVVKVFDPAAYDQTAFVGEVEALIDLNHPCVVRIVGWSPEDGPRRAEIWTEFAVHTSLKSVLEGVKQHDEPAFWTPTGKAIIICGIVLGMRYVHAEGYIHADLTPANILIKAGGLPLIGDFGTVCSSSPDAIQPSRGATLRYAAPELFTDDAPLTPSVDIFSFASIVFELLTEQPVFAPAASSFSTIRVLRDGKMPSLPEEHGNRMQDLIRRCWSVDPERRPSFRSILVEFAAAKFEIVRGAKAALVRDYVEGICKWERQFCYWM